MRKYACPCNGLKKIVVHRFRNKENAIKILTECTLKSKTSFPYKIINKFVDHEKKCIWVSEGSANIYNLIWSGMIQYGIKLPYIEFEYDAILIKRPTGIKRFFGKYQCVIESDIDLKNVNIIKVYPKCLESLIN